MDTKQRPVVVVSYGGGTDSTALLIECHKRGKQVDLILFADTGGEKPHTYAYIALFSKWLVDHGMPAITVVRRVNRKRETPSLEDDCRRNETLPSIAFGRKSCSMKYKVAPQDKFRNNWAPAKDCWASGGKVLSLIGYNADEPRRAKKTEDEKYDYRYPLIEWGIGRAAARAVIEEAGLPSPGKSACFFCPNSKKAEILDLRDKYPELLTRALEMENRARDGRHGLRSIKGLGRRFAWQDFVDGDARASAIAAASDVDLPCGCYDGGSDDET